jgi:hypothetical protein
MNLGSTSTHVGTTGAARAPRRHQLSAAACRPRRGALKCRCCIHTDDERVSPCAQPGRSWWSCSLPLHAPARLDQRGQRGRQGRPGPVGRMAPAGPTPIPVQAQMRARAPLGRPRGRGPGLTARPGRATTQDPVMLEGRSPQHAVSMSRRPVPTATAEPRRAPPSSRWRSSKARCRRRLHRPRSAV